MSTERAPKVSVIIPTYNRAALLRKAIESALAQTHQDFEIIIVDDASTDDTKATVAAIGDPRIHYIRHETNRRISVARNTGVMAAKGEYIAFLDDDDAWRTNKLEKQVEILETSAPTVGAVYTAFEQVDVSSGEVVGVIRPVKRGHILHELSSQNWIGTASTVCLRRRCFEEAGLFDEKMAFGEEYDMWIRVVHRFDFRYLDEVLVRYGLHTKRLSRDFSIMTAGIERQIQKHDVFFRTDPENHSRRYMSLGRLYCYLGDSRRGRQAFWKAIALSPHELKNFLYLALACFGSGLFTAVRSPKGLR